MKPSLTAGLLFCLLLALAFWLPGLGERPFHNDEAVNALKFRALWETGSYQYDPKEYHGPALPYVTWGLARIAGWKSFIQTTEADYRLVSVLAGLGLIALLALTADGLGQGGTFWAGVMIVLSSALSYFSRDYIHEIWLVFASFLLIAGLWRYWQRPSWRWALLSGLALGLMQATKETFVFNVIALGVAGGVCLVWRRLEAEPDEGRRKFAWPHLAAGLAMWLLVWAALFSSFFENTTGLFDSIRTYGIWLTRSGEDSVHVHPGAFFLERLFWFHRDSAPVWSELGMLGLATVAVVAGVRRQWLGDASAGLVRLLAVYTFLLFLAYSVIPYKTPWCILCAAHGLALLAGVGVVVLWRVAWKLSLRLVLSVVLAAVLVHLGWQSWTLTHAQVSARSNPWAYAATSPDIRNLVKQVEDVAAVSPAGSHTPIQVVAPEDDYWPLPFSLRMFDHVGFYSEMPSPPLAPIVVVSPKVADAIDSAGTHILAGHFQLRAGVFLRCYVEADLWEALLKVREQD